MNESSQSDSPTPEKFTAADEVEARKASLGTLLDSLGVRRGMTRAGEKALKEVGSVLMGLVTEKDSKLDAREAMVILDRCRMIAEAGIDKAMEPMSEFFDDRFSLEELQEITRFLVTPTGRKYLKVTGSAMTAMKKVENDWIDVIHAPARDELIARGVVAKDRSSVLDIIAAVLCDDPDCKKHAHAKKDDESDVPGKPA